MRKRIEQTEYFKMLLKKSPFLRSTYLSAANLAYLSELEIQVKKHGRDYLNDKQISARDLKILDELIK